MPPKKEHKEVKKSKSSPPDGPYEPSFTAEGSGEPNKRGSKHDKTGKGDHCALMEQAKGSLVPPEQSTIQKGSVENLDLDFYGYLTRAPVFLRNMRFSPILEDRVRHWVRKLITGNYPDYESKRKRNMYLSGLLIQIKNGDLKEPFTQEPPEVLPSASRVLKLKPPPDHSRVAAAKDVLLNAKEYLHIATQGRTYMATKILEDNQGACAYIGVSVGGNEPKWITPTGEEKCLPERDDLKVKEIVTRGDQAMFVSVNPGKSVHAVASERKPESERENLIEFYKHVLRKIEEAKEDENIDFDGPKDELLDQLLQMEKCESQAQGVPGGECTHRGLLLTLEKRIRGMLAQAIRRSREIQKLSVQANVVDENPKLVDISSMRAFDPSDDIWKTAITAEPADNVIQILKAHYPACIITVLLMLLERQRQIIIDQEKKTHEHLVATMKNELNLDVKDSIIKYEEAKRKFEKIFMILKKAEKVRNDQEATFGFSKDPMEGGKLPTPIGGDNSNAHAKEALVEKQLRDAKRRLELARQNAVEIDEKMDELTNQIAETQQRSEEANRTLKQDTVRWSKIICQMKSDLKAQERQIDSLQRFKESLGAASAGCIY